MEDRTTRISNGKRTELVKRDVVAEKSDNASGQQKK